jgi:hypothetical protein
MLFLRVKPSNRLVRSALPSSMDIHGGYVHVVLNTPVPGKMKSQFAEEQTEMNVYLKTYPSVVLTGTPGGPDLNTAIENIITNRTPFPKSSNIAPNFNNTTPKRPQTVSTFYTTPGGPAILTKGNTTNLSHGDLPTFFTTPGGPATLTKGIITKQSHVNQIEFSTPVANKTDDIELFSGEFWAGSKAKELGLVDELGNANEVLKEKFGEDVIVKKFEISIGWLSKKL